MSLNKVLATLFLILAAFSTGLAQQEKLPVNKDGQLEPTPEMIERYNRRLARLHDPSFIKLKIEPVSNCQDEEAKKVSDCYQVGGEIKLKLSMTNMSSEAIMIIFDRYNPSYTLQLFGGGQPVPYRKEMAKRLERPRAFSSAMGQTLEPGKEEMIELVYLGEWYEPLEPGHYQLDVKWRFVPEGDWTAPASTSFEVDPK